MTNIITDRFYSGLDFLTRGKVVVTNRLHGHILSTLLDILSLYLFLSLLFCMVFLFLFLFHFISFYIIFIFDV